MTSAENRNAVRAAEAKAKNSDEEKIIVVQGGDAIIYHVDPNDLELEELCLSSIIELCNLVPPIPPTLDIA